MPSIAKHEGTLLNIHVIIKVLFIHQLTH